MTQIHNEEYPQQLAEEVLSEESRRGMISMIGHGALGAANLLNPIRHRPGKFGVGFVAGVAAVGLAHYGIDYLNNERANDTLANALSDQAKYPTVIHSQVDSISFNYDQKEQLVEGAFTATADGHGMQYVIDAPLFTLGAFGWGVKVGDKVPDFRRNEQVSVSGTTRILLPASAVTQKRNVGMEKMDLIIDASQIEIGTGLTPGSGDVQYYTTGANGEKVFNGGMNFSQLAAMNMANGAAEMSNVANYLKETIPGPDALIGWIIDRVLSGADNGEMLKDITTMSNQSRNLLNQAAVAEVEQSCFANRGPVIKQLAINSLEAWVARLSASDRVDMVYITGEVPPLQVPEPPQIPTNGESTRGGVYDSFLVTTNPDGGPLVTVSKGTCPIDLIATPQK